MIRAVIIEDSELARFELQHLLNAHPQIQIIGQAADVDSAIALLDQITPTLAFLDIDLPGGSVFDVLERIERIPQLIFTTAFSEHALRAFDYHTIDYLLKPIEPARLALALAKLGDHTDSKAERFEANSPIFVKDGERCFLVRPREIRLIEAIGNYSRLYFATHSPMLYRTLGAIEDRLDPATFYRCSRKHLVNLSYVEQISNWTNGGLLLRLKDGTELEVSRRQSLRLRERLSF